MYFSACVYGLRHNIEAWTSAHPRLARTVQHFPSGTTALMEVCANEKSQPEIAKILIDNGAEIQRVPGMVFGSPLCVSVRQGHEAIARLLLEKDRSLINDPAAPLFSPLYWTLNQAHDISNAVPIIRMLLDFGANVNGNCSPFRDQSPLHLAARSFTPGLIELLIDGGASVDARDGEHGMTPLMVAVLNGVPENCKLLLAREADVHLKDWHHNSVLHFAFEHEDTTVARIPLDSGIDMNAYDGHGGTALHRTAGFRCGARSFAELLVRSKIDTDAKMLNGQTALHCASGIGHSAIVVLLLAGGANPDVVDHDGRTPLWTAAHLGQLESVKALAKVTNGINVQISTGHTALGIAAMQGHRAIVSTLLEAGAEIIPQEPGPHSYFVEPEERLEWYGVDALLPAYRKNHQSIVHLLLKIGAERDPNEYGEGLKLWDNSESKSTWTFTDWLDRRAARAETPKIWALREMANGRLDLAVKESAVRVAKSLAYWTWMTVH